MIINIEICIKEDVLLKFYLKILCNMLFYFILLYHFNNGVRHFEVIFFHHLCFWNRVVKRDSFVFMELNDDAEFSRNESINH